MIWNSPLVLPAEIFPDMSESDVMLELQLMVERSNAIANAIAGNMPASELAELIRAQDFEVDSWIDAIDELGERW
jgi:hypothetical protein